MKMEKEETEGFRRGVKKKKKKESMLSRIWLSLL